MIESPTYTANRPKIHVDGNTAFILDGDGNVSWKYDDDACGDIAIVACARSATQYMSKVLHKIGLNVGHEMQAPNGSVGYHLAAIRPSNCLHQVRHPLSQIASMMAHDQWGFMLDLVDIENDGLHGCMEYWLKWNKLCEEFCVWRYQIEQLPEVWDEFLERIGHEQCELPDVPTDTNKSKNLIYKLTWGDLFNEDKDCAERIMKTAKEYGYDVPEMDKAEYQNLREPSQAEVATV